MASELKKVVAPVGGDYTTLEACMNANEKNLVTSDEYFNVEISGDWSGTEDETNIVLHNYTTDATRFITIYAVGDAKHDGTAYKATAYEHKGADDTTSNLIMGGGIDYLVVKDFVFNGRGNAKPALAENSASELATFKNLIIHNNTHSGQSVGIQAGGHSQFINCILFNISRGFYSGSVSTTAKAYNCTVYGAASSSYGILRIVAVNCYVGNFDSECFYSLGSGSDYNVSSDTSASDESTNYTDSQSDYANYFESVSGGSEDFTLKNDTNTLWSLAGTDLSGTFTDDIIGTTRSAWDIGAFEYAVAGDTYNISESEAVTLTDSFDKTVILNRDLTETVTLTDSLSTSFIRTLSISETDSISLTDTFYKYKITDILGTDNLSLTDDVNLTLTINIEGSDSISLADTFDKYKTTEITGTESLSLADSLSKTAIVNRDFTETVTLTDTSYVVKLGAYEISETDTINLSDLLNKIFTLNRGLDDSTSLTDSVSISKLTSFSKTDTISFADSFSIAIAVAIEEISSTETVSLNDTFTITKITSISKQETLTLTDTQDIYKIQTHSISKSDSITFTDSFSIEEAVIKGKTLTFNPFTGTFQFLKDLTKVDSHILPDTNSTYDIGENTTPLRWREGYFTKLNIGDNTNYTEIKSNGEINLHGTARVTRHEVFNPTRFKLPGTNYPSETITGLFDTLNFDKSTEESAYTSEHIPYRWATDSDLKVIIDWMHDSADTGSVVWGIEYYKIYPGEVFTGSTTTILGTSSGNHTENELVRTEFTPVISGSDLIADGILGLRVFRDVDDEGDTLDEDAKFVHLHMHFIQDKLGQAT